MTIALSADRRQFLKGAGSLGLLIGFNLPLAGCSDPEPTIPAAGAAEFAPNAFLRITPDNLVTVISKHIEFGQGPYTGIATIIADELDADWAQIRVESAPADATKYANSAFGIQGTGGSTAMANSWEQLRAAGAEARARIIAAAAAKWKVDAAGITIDKGVVKSGSGASATLGELASLAQAVTLAQPAKPKEPSDWRLIGKHVPKVDTLAKTNGTAMFTIDVKMADLATCLIARPTRFGAKVKSFDPAAALAVKGVMEVYAIPQGVAVLADGYWAARKGRDALAITWDEAGTEARSSREMIADYSARARTTGVVARNEGDVEAALAGASKVIQATYTFPYLAHAPMEPNDCVIARGADGGVDMQFGSQLQTVDQGTAAAVLGLKPEQVRIKTLLAGGSFGRRATPNGEMAAEAAEVLKGAKVHKGPIKIIWTREDDIKGGRYRPIVVHRLRGGLDSSGNIVAWDQVIVGHSFIIGSPFEASMVKNGIDQTMVEGASNLPYQLPNLRVSAHIVDAGVPTLWWRSVGSTHTAYATEAFLDHLAAESGIDPLDIRRKLLSKHPRHLGALNLAAEKAGWGTPLPAGRARGLAVHESFSSYVAHVVEVSQGADGLPKVERVVCAADCGVAINPDVVKAQLEGGTGYGLSAILYGSIDLADGRVTQSNFDGYRVLRINEMPPVEAHVVPSAEPPTGIGEPGVPPVGPAVANAWAVLTGKRIHDLPFSRAVAGV